MDSETVRYTREHVGEDGLHILLQQIGFCLKQLVVGDKMIFLFDPNHEPLAQVGAEVLEQEILDYLEEKNISSVRALTPQSSKSEQMILTALEKVNSVIPVDIDVTMFQKSSSKEELEQRLGEHAYIVEYSPITNKSKYIGISFSRAMQLIRDYMQGKEFILVDDVYSSGETAKAMRMLVTMILGEDNKYDLPVFCVARELPEEAILDGSEDGVIASIIIPVLTLSDD